MIRPKSVLDPLRNGSVCLSIRQLHLKDGTVHVHCPRYSRPDSDKPPLQSDGNHAANHDIAISTCSKMDTNTASTCSPQPDAVPPNRYNQAQSHVALHRMVLNNLDHHTLFLASQPSNIFPYLPMLHAHAIWRAFFITLSARCRHDRMGPALKLWRWHTASP